ncbi:hypothetical protein [Tenacibaculum sp. 190130A14a]|uniref:CarboxypepD_reg-like domain-containing protein n=1 Tax=Tenacibaculum polynesiense TaxID=3137857 RepID=A0ABM9PG81_9FLAO
MKNNGLPIYGLACPEQQLIKTTVLSPNEKKCGCKTRQYASMPFTETKKQSAFGSQIIDGVTGNPFKPETVHIHNLSNGATTVTEKDGRFIIPAQADDMLEITHVGYGKITIKASDLTDKVQMNESFDALDEVVIKPKRKTGLALLGLAATLAIIYASADDEKKKS